MMKTCAVILTLLLALLSLDATNGSPRAMEGVLREKIAEDSMKINELYAEELDRILQEVRDYVEMPVIAPLCDCMTNLSFHLLSNF